MTAAAHPDAATCRIGLVRPDQTEPLIDLLCELNAHYHPGQPAARDTVRTHALRHLLAPRSPHRLVVASAADGAVVGLAAVAVVCSLVEPEPERGLQGQLKELFVSAPWRARGVGHALMAWAAAHLQAQGCHRIDWPVRADNARGIAFYQGLGAAQVTERQSWRLAGPALSALALQALPDAQRSAAC